MVCEDVDSTKQVSGDLGIGWISALVIGATVLAIGATIVAGIWRVLRIYLN